MKNFLLYPLLFLSFFLKAQDFRWGSLKYTDAIAVIPSMTGYHGGSISAIHRQSWTSISGAPTSSMLMGHTTIAQRKMGIGLVILNDNVNVLQTFQASIPLAYHLKTGKSHSFSFGLKTGFRQKRIVQSHITNTTQSDEVLANYNNTTSVDFDFSSQWNHQYAQLGVSFLGISGKNEHQFSSFVLFSNFFIPLKDEFDLIEPTFMLIKDPSGNWNFLSYVYYTFFEKLIVGAGYKSGNQILTSAGYSLKNRVILGYNYEYNASKYNSVFGSSHEVSIRYNLNQRYYDQKKYSILSKPIGGMNTN